MNLIFLSLLIGYMPFCNKKPHVELIKAESQMTAGGTVWSSTTIRYDVYFKTNSSSNLLKFEKIWIDNGYFEANDIHVVNLANNSKDFSKGDSIKVSFSKIIVNRPPEQLEENIQHNESNEIIPPPFKFDGQALISYSYKNKIYYFTIKSFEQLKPVLRP